MNDVFYLSNFDFPEGFLWGSATAGHQIEGDNVNSSCYHEEFETQKNHPEYALSGKACNSYNMWREDVDILSELKHQAFRMTIEWSRIEPMEGHFVDKEMDHYLQILNALKEKGIKVVLTIVHGTVPQWFSLKGAFTKIENLKYFESYLEYLVPKISQYIDYWCVFNEFNSSVLESNFDHKIGSIRFHARANSIIKKYSKSPVSTAHAFRQIYAKRQNDPFDLALEKYYDILKNEFWFHAVRTGEIVLPGREAFYDAEIKDCCDYWAVNTYSRMIVDSRIEKPTSGTPFEFNKIQLSHLGFLEFNPECFVQNFLRIKDKPVLVTENGIYTDDDRFRVVWILEYLRALRECIDLGVDVRGYLHWSLLDNYEWGTYELRFGLVHVDYENNFKRTIKPSAHFYREIIENNGYKKEMLTKYVKELPRCVDYTAKDGFLPENVN